MRRRKSRESKHALPVCGFLFDKGAFLFKEVVVILCLFCCFCCVRRAI